MATPHMAGLNEKQTEQGGGGQRWNKRKEGLTTGSVGWV